MIKSRAVVRLAGHTTASTDDASLFYERSLGTIETKGYRLTSAARTTDGTERVVRRSRCI
jgi:hypothetical protein